MMSRPFFAPLSVSSTNLRFLLSPGGGDDHDAKATLVIYALHIRVVSRIEMWEFDTFYEYSVGN